ncbi:unnamed protein product [Periconia digitata]|uniref:Transmembrane protein n=1 Tax=Periconia digitata TaxID=1303443 RepID=A0A9W4UEP9_9PLEO|nr:unnamed protein product [Periconia digitata]
MQYPQATASNMAGERREGLDTYHPGSPAHYFEPEMAELSVSSTSQGDGDIDYDNRKQTAEQQCINTDTRSPFSSTASVSGIAEIEQMTERSKKARNDLKKAQNNRDLEREKELWIAVILLLCILVVLFIMTVIHDHGEAERLIKQQEEEARLATLSALEQERERRKLIDNIAAAVVEKTWESIVAKSQSLGHALREEDSRSEVVRFVAKFVTAFAEAWVQCLWILVTRLGVVAGPWLIGFLAMVWLLVVR